jgi:hypothetical protein
MEGLRGVQPSRGDVRRDLVGNLPAQVNRICWEIRVASGVFGDRSTMVPRDRAPLARSTP